MKMARLRKALLAFLLLLMLPPMEGSKVQVRVVGPLGSGKDRDGSVIDIFAGSNPNRAIRRRQESSKMKALTVSLHTLVNQQGPPMSKRGKFYYFTNFQKVRMRGASLKGFRRGYADKNPRAMRVQEPPMEPNDSPGKMSF